jgi:preprotein translocase subunit SecF
VLFIWGYFREWKMSVAGIVALAHDIIITMGVYSLSGFTVTPAAVTGLLAILGFSMYDTVVVFDKVRENTQDLRRSNQSYRQAANLAVNQTLVRSINTSLVALIPIGAILVVSSALLGSSSLQDLALAQFVGMGVGVYSSVFVAPRLLVHMKEREKDIMAADRRAKVRAKRDADRYADVPAFTEDMPLVDEPGDEDPAPKARIQAPIARPTAAGSGRVVPDPKAPVQQSGSAHRPQPTRQPRSKRGK